MKHKRHYWAKEFQKWSTEEIVSNSVQYLLVISRDGLMTDYYVGFPIVNGFTIKQNVHCEVAVYRREHHTVQGGTSAKRVPYIRKWCTEGLYGLASEA